jgi:dTDP-4-amino-4,6-dideoxygalactose transaminase
MISVPMFNLAQVNDVDKLTKVSTDVLNSLQHILGPNVHKFEIKFANYIGVNHCLGVANGSDALVIALRAIGVKKNDEVATVANAGFYACAALNLIGAIPVFIDVDPDSLLIDPIDLEKKLITNNIKAVVVTHLYGQAAPIKDIIELCSKSGIKVVEDCAQAHGAQVDGKKVGSFGDISTFSFYPTKNLGAVGDGGAVLTNDGQIAKIVKQIRQYGWGEKYSVEIENGTNSRLDELQAAFLLAKLEDLDNWNQQRITIAKQYVNAFEKSNVKVLKNTLKGVAHLFVILTEDRDELIEHLAKNRIQSGIHYPISDHKQAIYKEKFKDTNLPITEGSVAKILSLPIYPGMKQEEIDHVVKIISNFKRKLSAR